MSVDLIARHFSHFCGIDHREKICQWSLRRYGRAVDHLVFPERPELSRQQTDSTPLRYPSQNFMLGHHTHYRSAHHAVIR